MEIEIGVMWPQTRQCWQLLISGGGKVICLGSPEKQKIICKELYYEEWAHVVMEAKKSQDT